MTGEAVIIAKANASIQPKPVLLAPVKAYRDRWETPHDKDPFAIALGHQRPDPDGSDKPDGPLTSRASLFRGTATGRSNRNRQGAVRRIAGLEDHCFVCCQAVELSIGDA